MKAAVAVAWYTASDHVPSRVDPVVGCAYFLAGLPPAYLNLGGERLSIMQVFGGPRAALQRQFYYI